ncbi:MAG: hypothetical protein M0R03_14835, partial [Novosphingobium sp.]|nr:hypothetical protein [Novosphingobium sp.]
YPLGKTSTASLQKSFTESRLVPAPYKMAGAGNTKVPYTPKTSRLPTDTPGTPQMWTAWENRLKPDTPLGTTATVGKGSSEIGGMYGAPVALTYFTKAGNKSPKLFGLDFPSMKRPSLLRTTVSSLEAIPNKLSKETLSLKASGTGTEEAYAAINAFLKQNADPGKAYFPNTKAEYEAVLPEGNVLSLKGSQYYTKVAGGHRVPIYEFETTGEIISGKTKSTGKGRFSGKKSGSDYLESLEPKPYISGFNLLSSIIGVSGRGSKSLTRRYKLDRYVDYSYSAIEHASSSYALKSRGLSSLKSLGYSFLGSSVLRSGSSVKSYPGSSLQYPKSFSKAMPLGYYGYPNTYDKDFTFSKIDSSGNQIRQHKPKSRQKNWNFIEFYPLADVNKLLRF